ncbi:MAG: hypothetical protein ACR2NP_00090 [Pirellulaceae bacterium]
MNQQRKLPYLVAMLALLVPGYCGCQSGTPTMDWSRLNPFPAKAETEPEYEQPLRMAVIWKETTLSAPGKKPTRGFGGRIYFYGEESEPIRANGQLTIYAFDDSETDPEQTSAVPQRKYVFKAEHLQQHHSITDIGSSYSVWVPWDEVGGMRRTISLLPVFNPDGGKIIQADQSIAVLPGRTTEQDDFSGRSSVRQVSASIEADQHVASASHAAQSASGDIRNGRPQATTIRVPRSLANGMKQLNQREPQMPARPRQTRDKESELSQQEVAQQQQLMQRVSGEQLQVQTLGQHAEKERSRPVAFGQPGSYR